MVDQVVVNITATGPQRITLNLDVPGAGTYSIGGSGMNMFRNNANVAYPYTLPGVLDIISSSAGANFYYYYYNWEIEEAPCHSELVPVVANVNIIDNNPSSTNATCTASNGSATVAPTGGSTPYNYLWSTGGTNASAASLPPASYTITVTDDIGCEQIDVINVGSNTLTITSTTSTVDVNCANAGSATATATNGSGSPTYLWSNGATTATANNLAAATYTVTITDANGCVGTNTATVNDNSITIMGTTNSSDASCGQSNGSASATPTNGVGSYSFLWSNGATDATINNVSANNYSVTITDGNGCTGVLNVSVNNANGPTSSASSTNVLCNGMATGTATATASGGTGGLSYLWSNGATDAVATGLVAGIYSVTITDGNACTAFETVTVTEPSALMAASVVTDVSSAGGNDGAIDLTTTGGTSGYMFNWSNGATTEDINNLTSGMYYVTITDANGCTVMDSVFVQDGPTSIRSTELALFVNLYPNPSNSTTILDFGLAKESDVQIRVVDVLGQVLQENAYSKIKELKYAIDVSEYPAAVYFVQLVVGDQMVSKRLVVRRD